VLLLALKGQAPSLRRREDRAVARWVVLHDVHHSRRNEDVEARVTRSEAPNVLEVDQEARRSPGTCAIA
jgi:hypothetical protein